MNKAAKLNLSIFLVTISIVLTGIYYKNVNSTINQSDECDLTNSECVFSLKNTDFSVKFVTSVVVEEEIFIEFDLPQHVKMRNAWVEGVNMFMGRTPILLENDRYVTFLGSCNLDVMVWRLHFTLEEKNGQTHVYSAVFSTYT